MDTVEKRQAAGNSGKTYLGAAVKNARPHPQRGALVHSVARRGRFLPAAFVDKFSEQDERKIQRLQSHMILHSYAAHAGASRGADPQFPRAVEKFQQELSTAPPRPEPPLPPPLFLPRSEKRRRRRSDLSPNCAETVDNSFCAPRAAASAFMQPAGAGDCSSLTAPMGAVPSGSHSARANKERLCVRGFPGV